MPPPSSPPVVIVTGASSGIGLAVAQQAAIEGDHVVLVARDEATLDLAAKECERAGAASTLVIPTDVGDDEAPDQFGVPQRERHGRLAPHRVPEHRERGAGLQP